MSIYLYSQEIHVWLLGWLKSKSLGGNSTMQVTRVQLGQLPKLFHVQTNTYIDLPLNLSAIHIGKPNDRIPPNIDVSNFPNADAVSRVHASILIEGNNYSIEDSGSANGTYLNHSRLTPLTPHALKLEDRIDLGKENQVTFLFKFTNNIPASEPQATNDDYEQEQVALFTRVLGLALMLGGLGFLSSSVVLGSFTLMYLPALGSILVVTAGVLTLTYGRANRNLGWILIAVGVVAAFASGGIVLQSITLMSFLLAFGAMSAGYQLFTAGRLSAANLLPFKRR